MSACTRPPPPMIFAAVGLSLARVNCGSMPAYFFSKTSFSGRIALTENQGRVPDDLPTSTRAGISRSACSFFVRYEITGKFVKNFGTYPYRPSYPQVQRSLDPRENTKRESPSMWISLFTVASGAAICLSVAAVMMQPAEGRPFRG
jgi:hypothetical protein